MSVKNENYEIMKENQNNLRDLEQFYTNNKVDTMLSTIEQQKEKITDDIIQFAKTRKLYKYTKEGEKYPVGVECKPLVINNYFFKSILPIQSNMPQYNAEKLGLVYDYYCQILAEVNDKIGNFPSSLTSFCKLAGITMNELRSYRNSNDLSMRVITEKIYDEIGDVNITMSQMGIVSERTTIFKMKSQNEMIEKQQPTVHVTIIEQPDMEQIENKINKYKSFANKKAGRH